MPESSACRLQLKCRGQLLVTLVSLLVYTVCLCGCQVETGALAQGSQNSQIIEVETNYRILVVPVAWRSRAFTMLKLSYELAARGNTVTVLMAQAYEKWTYNSLQAFARARRRRAQVGDAAAAEQAAEEMPAGLSLVLYGAWDMETDAEKIVDASQMEQFNYVMENTLDSCKHLMANETINRIVAQGRFDIIVGDLANFCGTTLAEFWRLPRVDYDSGACRAGAHFTAYNQPFSPAVTPSHIAVVPSNTVLGFKDRVANVGATMLLHAMIAYVVTPRLQEFRKTINMTSYLALLPQDHPALAGQGAAGAGGQLEMMHNVESTIRRLLLVVVNVDWAFGDVRSVGPNFKFVGPMHPDLPAPLPPTLHTFMTEGDPWVIYVSPGSTFSFGDPGNAHLLKALLSLPGRYRVIWRAKPSHRRLLAARLAALGSPPLEDLAATSRLALLDWAPQNDLLGQPATRLFVSHCGINGLNEAVYHGVPVLCIPSVADQPINAAMLASYGNGRALDLARLNAPDGEALVRREVLALLEDESYARTARLLSARMRSHPVPAVVRAAEWVEYAAGAARAGPPGFLVPAEARVAWWRLAMMDVWAAAAGAAGLVAWGLGRALAARFRSKRKERIDAGIREKAD